MRFVKKNNINDIAYRILFNHFINKPQSHNFVLPTFKGLMMERPKKKVKKGRNKKVKKEETEVEDEAPFDFMNFSDYIQAAGDLPEVAYMNYYKLADFDVNIVLSSLYLSGMEYFEELTKSLNNDLLMDIDMIRERFDVDKMQKECYYLNDGDLLELNKVIMRIRAYSLLYKEENQQYKGIMKEFLDCGQ